MPRYRYLCESCDAEKMIFHLYNEDINLDCEACGSTNALQKMVNVPHYNTKERQRMDKQPVGQLTKEYIEENREILEREKQKAKEEVYESP